MSDNLQQHQRNSVFCLDGNDPVSESTFVFAFFQFNHIHAVYFHWNHYLKQFLIVFILWTWVSFALACLCSVISTFCLSNSSWMYKDCLCFMATAAELHISMICIICIYVWVCLSSKFLHDSPPLWTFRLFVNHVEIWRYEIFKSAFNSGLQ